MRHLLFLAICGLGLISCGPTTPPKPSIQTKEKEEVVVQSAPIIKVFVENSGSMDGYVKGATDFENAVYSYLSDIQHADLGVKENPNSSKNVLELNYINSKVLKQNPDVQAFTKALEPSTFKQKGGNRGTSDMSDIINKILSQTSEREISIFVSDCIFSPGKQYRAKDNADEYIIAQRIGIKSHIVEKLAENPNFAIVVLRLLSQFNGIYYNKFDDHQGINSERPFYIWLMGDRELLKRIVDKVDLTQIKGTGVKNVFMASKSNGNLSYGILPQRGIGKFNLDKANPKTTITNAKVDGKGGSNCFQLAVGVNYSNMLLPEEYLINSENYTISNKTYNVEIVKNTNINSTYTHILKLNLTQPIISKGAIKISLLNQIPTWVDTYTDEDGLDINVPEAMKKTYGLKHLIGGVYDAFAAEKNYGTITINIK